MRVSRFKVTVLVLLVATAVYAVALHLDIQRYEVWKQSYLENHPDVAPWIDFNPYIGTFTGGLLLITGVLLGGSFLMVVIHRKKLKSAMLMVLLFIVVSAFMPSACAGYYEKTIDVLAVQDEEFRFLYPAGWERDLGWGIYIDIAFERFEEEFGMVFKLRGWIDWDSTDYAGDLYDLLEEAIDETNFESHVTTYNGYVIDILMVFTGEPADGIGFSPAPWKALIIYALPDAPRARIIQHELSHQFWVLHCNNDCLMNPDKWELGQVVPDYWCGPCATTMDDNKDRFWRWITGGGGGGEPPTREAWSPSLFVWNGSEYVEEVVLDLHGDSDVAVWRIIEQTVVSNGNHYLLSLRELNESISHIDCVKLYMLDAEDEINESHLTYAMHNELGNVKQLLKSDDDERVDLQQSQIIDLEFHKPEIENIAYFIFVIQGFEPY